MSSYTSEPLTPPAFSVTKPDGATGNFVARWDGPKTQGTTEPIYYYNFELEAPEGYYISQYQISYYDSYETHNGGPYVTWHVKKGANVGYQDGAVDSYKSHRTFDDGGWEDIVYEVSSKTTAEPAAQVTFAEVSCPLSVTVQSGSGTVTGAGTYKTGDSVTVTATPAAGYKFVKWTSDAEGQDELSTSSSYTFNITIPYGTEKVIIYAWFEQIVLSFSAEARPSNGGGGTVDGHATSTVSLRLNESHTFVAASNRAAFWGYCGYTDTTAAYPQKFLAETAENFWTARYNSTGQTSGEVRYYQFCSALEIVAVSSDNNAGAVAVVSSEDFDGSDPNHNVSNGLACYYVHGPATVSATPQQGYEFDHWKLTCPSFPDGTDAGYGASFTWNRYFDGTNYGITLSKGTHEQITFTAYFKKIKYTITATPSPPAGGIVTGGGEYSYGDASVLTATPAQGYRFVEWQEGGTRIGDDNPYSFTVSDDRTIYAIFESLPLVDVIAISSPLLVGIQSIDNHQGIGSFMPGTTVSVSTSLSAAESEQYAFVKWSGSDGSEHLTETFSYTVSSTPVVFIAIYKRLDGSGLLIWRDD